MASREQDIRDYIDGGNGVSLANTDEEILAHLNNPTETRWNEISSAQIYEAIVPSDFQDLTNAEQVRVDRILGLAGDIATAPGAQARGELIGMFGGGSETITNLAAIASEPTTPGIIAELGLVRIGEIARARLI